MTRLSRASGITSTKEGSTWRAPSPPRNTTRLWRIKSCPKLNDEELWSCNIICQNVAAILLYRNTELKLQGNISYPLVRVGTEIQVVILSICPFSYTYQLLLSLCYQYQVTTAMKCRELTCCMNVAPAVGTHLSQCAVCILRTEICSCGHVKCSILHDWLFVCIICGRWALNISFDASFNNKESCKGIQETAELNSMRDYITSVWLCREFSMEVTLVFIY